MDLRSLRYFTVVAEELNITRASEKLLISQPPLSNQIKALENELNTTLFIRGKRHLQLTESGKLLYRQAKEILDLAEKAASEIKTLSNGMNGTISIGLVEGSAPNIAASWIASFMEEYPGISFRIMDGNSDELIEKLRSGLINLAVITSPCDQTLLDSFKVGQEKMTAFMSTDHPLAKRSGNSIRLLDLKDEPLIVPSRDAIVDMIYEWFKEIKSEPKIVCKMDNYLDVAALAGKGIGVSIFPKTSYILNPQIVAKEIIDPERDVEYLFVWLKGRPLPQIDETFIDHVKETAKGSNIVN
ncbi:MAG: LysR family transcriptional regulator [Erysipelotrichaceae bacterium]|nr:LysR family transcriptional regulator [Erysipelotrichaceae bacterium]